MNLLIDKIISSILQIFIFTVLPFIWWFVTDRKDKIFFEWIGLKSITGGKKTWTAIIIVSILFMLVGMVTLFTIKNVKTATSDFSGLGVKAIPAIIIYAAFNTALPEELVFRGFILKRVMKISSFNIANIIQALMFGLLHGIMFSSLVGNIEVIFIVLITGVIAWFMGRINEIYSDGSILPSLIIHTVSNIFSGICYAFLIVWKDIFDYLAFIIINKLF